MRIIRLALIALTAIAAITAVSCGNSPAGPTYRAEGSKENPVDLGDPETAPLVYYGEVDTTTISVYQVDVDPDHGPGYHITLTDLLDDADLAVSYDNNTIHLYSGTVGKNADEELDAYPTGPILYIAVIGWYTQRGTTFTLTITKN